MVTSHDVVVIGGGVIGTSIAWRLSATGSSVALIDDSSRDPAAGVAAGMLAPVTEAEYGEESLLRLTLASSEMYPAFAAELSDVTGHDIGYRQCGTVMAARDLDDNTALEEVFRFQTKLGLAVTRLSGSETRRLEPALGPRTRGGILIEDDHQVDPPALLVALTEACKRCDVAMHEGRVEAVVWNGDRASGVTVGTGDTIAGGTVVIAAGAWSSAIEGVPSGALPAIRPVKGQLIQLRSRDGAPLATRNIRGLDVYFVPRADGRVVVGGTVEEQGFDTTITAGAVRTLLRDAYELAPGIAEFELVDVAAGVRPTTLDNAPVLGPVADGLVVASGHYRNGVLLAPLTASVIADVVTTGRIPDVAASFGPGRFERGLPV